MTVTDTCSPALPAPVGVDVPGLRIDIGVEFARCPEGNEWTQPVISIRPEVPWMGAIAVATRPDGSVLMVRMYRHTLGGYAWELPQGRADLDDADESATAAREMLEETGYAPDGPGHLIGWHRPMTGLMRHRAAVVAFTVAADAVPAETDGEVHAVGWFTPEQVGAMIAAEEIVCSATIVPLALHWLARPRG